jgi:hypothetical protein
MPSFLPRKSVKTNAHSIHDFLASAARPRQHEHDRKTSCNRQQNNDIDGGLQEKFAPFFAFAAVAARPVEPFTVPCYTLPPLRPDV